MKVLTKFLLLTITIIIIITVTGFIYKIKKSMQNRIFCKTSSLYKNGLYFILQEFYTDNVVVVFLFFTPATILLLFNQDYPSLVKNEGTH